MTTFSDGDIELQTRFKKMTIDGKTYYVSKDVTLPNKVKDDRTVDSNNSYQSENVSSYSPEQVSTVTSSTECYPAFEKYGQAERDSGLALSVKVSGSCIPVRGAVAEDVPNSLPSVHSSQPTVVQQCLDSSESGSLVLGRPGGPPVEQPGVRTLSGSVPSSVHSSTHDARQSFNTSGIDVTDAVPVSPYNTRRFASVPQMQEHYNPTSLASRNRWDVVAPTASSSDEYDVYVMSSLRDEPNARILESILEKFVTLSDGRKPSFYPEPLPNTDMLEYLEEGLQCSRFKFLYFDQGCKQDEWLAFQQNNALWRLIERRDQSVVPVKARPDVQLPSLLRVYRALEVSRLLRGKHLDDIHDVNSLKDSDVDFNLIRNIAKMIDPLPSVRTRLAVLPPSSAPRHVQNLRRKYRKLIDNMDPDSGLLGALFSTEVISFREMESIRTERTFFDRNECLLKMLLRKSETDYMKFVDALTKVSQEHIAEELEPGLTLESSAR